MCEGPYFFFTNGQYGFSLTLKEFHIRYKVFYDIHITHGIISCCGLLFRSPIFVFTRYQNTDSVIQFYFQNTFVRKMNCGILESSQAYFHFNEDFVNEH